MTDPSGSLFSGALAAIIVTIGGKILDRRFKRQEKSEDDVVAFRRELRERVDQLGDKCDTLQSENDKWRADYWKLRDEFTEIRSAHEDCLRREKALQGQIDQMRAENGYLRGEVEACRRELDALRRGRGAE